MVRRAEVLAVKSDYLSSIPEAHTVEGMLVEWTVSRELPSDFDKCVRKHVHVHTRVQQITQISVKQTNKTKSGRWTGIDGEVSQPKMSMFENATRAPVTFYASQKY